jgi:hypothetical protein
LKNELANTGIKGYDMAREWDAEQFWNRYYKMVADVRKHRQSWLFWLIERLKRLNNERNA